MFPDGDAPQNIDVPQEIKETAEDFYKNAKEYWSHLPPTENAVLGGYAHISQIDIQGSRNFLQQILASDKSVAKARAIDCGAGIGRITRSLLTNFYKTVDLVEQNPQFLEEAKAELAGCKKSEHVGVYYPLGLQDFKPEHKYDVIWCQWVLGHLTNDDLVEFFIRCRGALTEKGFIVVKENMASCASAEIDSTDSSMTRPYSLFMELFSKAGLKCFKKQKQMHFPKELYTVYMFALRAQIVEVGRHKTNNQAHCHCLFTHILGKFMP